VPRVDQDQRVPRVPDVGDDPVAARDAAAAQVRQAADAIAAELRVVVPRVVELQVRGLVAAWGRLSPEERHAVERAARAAGSRAAADLAEAWEVESAKPLPEQRHGPLEFLRSLRRYPTEVLSAAGIPAVRRDRFMEERFPDDVYGLIVERFLELPGGTGANLHALHLAWGVGRALWVKAEQAVRARQGSGTKRGLGGVADKAGP